LLFFILTFLSLYLFIHNNDFQRSKYMSVFQEISGKVYTVSNSIESYMHLRTVRDDLSQKVADLEQEILLNRREIEVLTDNMRSSDTIFKSVYHTPYRLIPARLVHNQISETENYITLNKGSNDGIKADMGVLSSKGGVVGLVMRVSPNFSLVIPLLNPNSQLSCKIKTTNYFGSLVWSGKDPLYSYLGDLPGHAVFNTGDTIVTSGYSSTFPEGILVGVIADTFKQKNDGYNSLKIKLFTDFSTLSEVLVVENKLKEEQKKIEKGGIE